MPDRKHILFGDDESDTQWVAEYTMSLDEFDDNFQSEDVTEIDFRAFDFDTATRYAQQYLRKMKSDESTSEKWENAQLISLEMY